MRRVRGSLPGWLRSGRPRKQLSRAALKPPGNSIEWTTPSIMPCFCLTEQLLQQVDRDCAIGLRRLYFEVVHQSAYGLLLPGPVVLDRTGVPGDHGLQHGADLSLIHIYEPTRQ